MPHRVGAFLHGDKDRVNLGNVNFNLQTVDSHAKVLVAHHIWNMVF